MRMKLFRAPVLAAAALGLSRAALAATAQAAPGAERPEWVVWTALGALLALFAGALVTTQGSWRGKGRNKKEGQKPPYF
jgi:hypothetical protein